MTTTSWTSPLNPRGERGDRDTSRVPWGVERRATRDITATTERVRDRARAKVRFAKADTMEVKTTAFR